jgi:peptidoglycan hydrolase CwlO-like protein
MRSYLPVSLVSRKPRRSSFPPVILRTPNILIISKQGYEDAIENMKVQFAAISEEKAEVERKLEPLVAESAKLKKQADEFDNHKQHMR